MRPLAAADIISFYASTRDLLTLTGDGRYEHFDTREIRSGQVTAYNTVTTDEGEVRVLLERAALPDADWHPGPLARHDQLDTATAARVAETVMRDGVIAPLVQQADEEGAGDTERACVVAEIVAYCGGDETAAGRHLGISPDAVHELLTKNASTA
ncbi:hypothetical protein [Streptomyces sp. enrichment culture]|uniref:hypothetical protein n=1 Tax=Streptomyces sp. enrichment culture TaxID=1795815 RepID=UPI003F5557B3